MEASDCTGAMYAPGDRRDHISIASVKSRRFRNEGPLRLSSECTSGLLHGLHDINLRVRVEFPQMLVMNRLIKIASILCEG